MTGKAIELLEVIKILHNYLISYINNENALSGKYDNSQYYKSLNWECKFNWVRKPLDWRDDFYKDRYNILKCNNIPSNWELEAIIPGAKTHNEYMIWPGYYSYSFNIRPFDKRKVDIIELSKKKY